MKAISRFRYHLPKLGIGLLVAALVTDLALRPWDVTHYRRYDDWLFYVTVLVSIAVGPGAAIGVLLYTRDRYYNESWRLLIKLFVLCVLLAPVAGFGELLADWALSEAKQRSFTATAFVMYFGVVALLEELAKFLAAYLLVYRSRLFKQVYDGILFCGMAALGFATVENLIYVLTAGDEALGVAIGRALTAVPSHVAVGVVMGYGMGKAREARGTAKEHEWLILGLGAAILMHGAYDFILVAGGVTRPYLFFPTMLASWGLAGWMTVKALAHSPYTDCAKCRTVIPRLASYCPSCNSERSVDLHCWRCHTTLSKWSRRCPNCNVRVKFPWHLRVGRLKDLYPRVAFVPCGNCDEEIPADHGYCLHCGGSRAM